MIENRNTLIVIPAVYGLVKGWRLPAGAEQLKAVATEKSKVEVEA